MERKEIAAEIATLKEFAERARLAKEAADAARPRRTIINTRSQTVMMELNPDEVHLINEALEQMCEREEGDAELRDATLHRIGSVILGLHVPDLVRHQPGVEFSEWWPC